MELMYTMRDVDDLKLQRRATMSLPWLTDILHGCEANLAARQQEAERSRQQAEEERQAQARSLDEQIAAAVAAAMKAQTTGSPTGNGARKPPAPPALEPTNDTDPSWCPIHRCTMERRTNERGSWFRHRLADRQRTAKASNHNRRGMSTAPIRRHADADTTRPPPPCAGHDGAPTHGPGHAREQRLPRPQAGLVLPRLQPARTTRSTTAPGALPTWRRPSASCGPMSCARWRSGRLLPRRDLVEDLTQEGLLACWTRRHAPHIQNFPRYYAAMLRGLVTQHCKRLQREQEQLRPLEEAGPC